MTTGTRTLVALGLVLLTLLAFAGVLKCDFIGFDDPLYVSANPHIRDGLSGHGLRWGLSAGLLFDSPNADYWAPLTVFSRMVDVELFGLQPAGHHLTNLLLHALNAALLFLVLEGMTGAGWRSAFVAAFFAVHPLRVESVAWITERKDVLSGLFGILTLGAYARYARSPDRVRYAMVVLMLALGLMAKPMLLTLPFVLLLLDQWPLLRAAKSLRARVLEKLPLFGLSGLSLLITYLPLWRRGQITELDALPLDARITNALYSYLVYAGKMFWPQPLAVVYPHPEGHLSFLPVAAAVAFLVLGTGEALRRRRRHPYGIVGWLWYLGMLLPVLGLVQSGVHARADRYTYLPLIGLSLIVAWGAAEALGSRPNAKPALAVIAALWIAVLILVTRRQVDHWRDTATLFEHAIRVTTGNYLAENNLATALAVRGDAREAEAHYREAIRIRPDYTQAEDNLGVLLARQGRMAEAMALHEEALRVQPRDAEAHFNLGLLNARSSRTSEAAQHYAEALRLNPRLASAHYNWGNLMAGEGRWSEAAEHFASAVRLQPDHAMSYNNLGLAQALLGKWPEAMGDYARALEIDPRLATARINLGRALVAQGRHSEAIEQYLQVLRDHPRDADAHFYLGLALAAEGRMPSAREHFEEALRIDPSHGEARRALAAGGAGESH
ncbi:MAG TPA: tetratricopeptide repeat protein [Vicinamibacteria bacterium]|nr:tetratricopeptide repeat protein [Vicinamibacteria bacterium]